MPEQREKMFQPLHGGGSRLRACALGPGPTPSRPRLDRGATREPRGLDNPPTFVPGSPHPKVVLDPRPRRVRLQSVQ